MSMDWSALLRWTGAEALVVERVRLVESDIAVEGAFELPTLARLSADDQVFVAAFVRAHGSIKEMETLFGVSYPTIKARLNRLAGELDVVKVAPVPEGRRDLFDRLERGEITVDQAIEELKKGESRHE